MEEQAYYTEGSDEPQRREGQVIAALRELDTLIGDVDGRAEQLAKRLEPIIAHHPEKAGTLSEDRATGAPLADDLARYNDRLRGISERLRYLLDTVQV